MTKADKINKALEDGYTVMVTTYLKSFRITPKTAKSWKEAGHPYFKMDGKSCVMIEGHSRGKPRYACIDGNRITAS
jgi:hypothetical protein